MAFAEAFFNSLLGFEQRVRNPIAGRSLAILGASFQLSNQAIKAHEHTLEPR
jgi:hypothetical protein